MCPPGHFRPNLPRLFGAEIQPAHGHTGISFLTFRSTPKISQFVAMSLRTLQQTAQSLKCFLIAGIVRRKLMGQTVLLKGRFEVFAGRLGKRTARKWRQSC